VEKKTNVHGQTTRIDCNLGADTTPVRTPLIIIGCGFGGIAQAIALKKAGFHDFIILERGGEVGGVWRDNTYPGAACDIVSRLYSYSFDRKRKWSTNFAPQEEILAYIRGVVERYGIRPHVRFNMAVCEAAFDARIGRWRVSAESGQIFEAPVLVSAVGVFNAPAIPNFAGRESFEGAQFHSAQWDHSVSLKGKRVAIVGNGASCVQFLPRVAEQASHLTLYQRSPQYVLPKVFFPGNAPLDIWLTKHPALRWLARLRNYLLFERVIFRRRHFPETRKIGEAAYAAMLEQKVKDPELRRKLTPDYALGCKRVLVSDQWIDALVRPNVSVVTEPIDHVDASGIATTEARHREFDVIIYGTGFRPTEYLAPMRITGLHGLELNAAWRDGAEAYLGIVVPGFPNFFMMYGPNTTTITSIIFMLECQARYIVSCLKVLRRKGASWMNIRAARHVAFAEEMKDRLSRLVPAMANCHSYFKQENGRITTVWPGYTTEYLLRTWRTREGEYEYSKIETD
jgi:cation diffusion facilitator CzcD-associated flavoprotein CzcO